MNQYRQKRNYLLLYVLLVVAVAYGVLLLVLHSLTGQGRLDGSVGVILGLFICSRPVANVLDMILYGHLYTRQVYTRRATNWWLVLNGWVLLVGVVVIVVGTTRFTASLH